MQFRSVAMASILIGLAGCAAETSPTPPGPRPGGPPKSSSVTQSGSARKAATPAEDTPVAATSGQEKAKPSAEPAKESEGPSTPAAPLEAALELVSNGELGKALDLLREAQKTDAQNREITLALTQFSLFHAAQKMQTETHEAAAPLFLESASHARRLVKDFAPLSEAESSLASKALYNEACVLARSGKSTEAIAALNDAVGLGFNDLKHLDTDEDLASLRDQDEFKSWRTAAEAKVAELRQQRIQKLFAANEPFPFDFALNDFEGQPHKLADLKDKVVIVDFWATWCPPCRDEIPHLVELHKKYREQGLEVVGLNYENEEGAEAAAVIKKFHTENGMTYPCLIGDEATQQQVPNFEGFPTMLFLDRSGKVRLKLVGYTPHETLEAIIALLLNETAPG